MQSRKKSTLESIANIIAGVIINVVMLNVICTAFGLNYGQDFVLFNTVIFTIMSFLRSYTIRRIFNRMDKWKRLK